MCNFSHLTIHDNCSLITKNTTCLECGYNNLEFTVDATYLGHAITNWGVVDCFKINSDIVCESCGTKIIQYEESCDEGLNWVVKKIEEIKSEKIK